MARDFTKDVANYMKITTLGGIASRLHGASACSMHVWAYIDSFTAGQAFTNDALCFRVSTQAAGGYILFDTTGSNFIKAFGRSEAADSGQTAIGTTAISTGEWVSCGIVYDYANDKIRIYTNGNQDADTTVAFGSATFVDANSQTRQDSIGTEIGSGEVPPNTTRMMDGRIADAAIWKGDIGQQGFSSLSARIPAGRIHRNDLISYFPLFGVDSPEPDYTGSDTADITGTINQIDHAPLAPIFSVASGDLPFDVTAPPAGGGPPAGSLSLLGVGS